MSTTTTDTTPRVWIACLACYNDGRLVGEWFDAVRAAEVTLDDVHGGANLVRWGCEELWVMDHENIPVLGEMSPAMASAWGELLEEVHENDRPAFLSWVLLGDYASDGRGALPSELDFAHRYCGQWTDFDDYARVLATDLGLLDGVREDVARYFDWAAWARDVALDYTTCEAVGGGVFVFRAL